MAISCLFEVVGNIVYFIANDVYCLVEARILGGLGCGAGASAFAYIALSTTKKERTSMMGAVSAARQIGTMIGPGFNFGLALVDFRIGSLHIDANRAPGMLLMLLWAVGVVLVLVWFVDLYHPARLAEDEREKKQEVEQERHQLLQKQRRQQGGGGEKIGLIGEEWLLDDTEAPEEAGNQGWGWLYSLPVVSVMVISFLLAFNQMTLETWVTPLTQVYFGWHERQNSVMYTSFGVVVLIAFVLLRVLSKRGISDRAMMLSGIALEFAT